jgi:protein-S-isoprenylcysteine O-methyltransferase Ste14
MEAQQRFLRSLQAQLILLVTAAIGGAFTWRFGGSGPDWAGFTAAVAFFLAALLRIDLLRSRPERTWYDGRAAAESAKTLAWRYSVGGEPLRLDVVGDAEADRLFIARLNDLLNDLRGIHLVPSVGTGDQITSAMRDLRKKTLDDRKLAYESGRIDDQRSWYASKARWNERRARVWNTIMLGLEAVGVVGAILKATATIETDILGITGAGVAGAAAWLQAKQHLSLASAYSVASQELASIKALVAQPSTEAEWAHFVDQAEEAISREHTLWRASHS